MRWSGVLDRRALESAAQIALERHPLMRSHVELVGGETPRWIISPETTCAIDWQIGLLRAIGIRGGGRSAVRTAYRVDDAAQLER